MSIKYLELVHNFHAKFGLDGLYLTHPGFPSDDLLGFRLNFMLEELCEMADAAGFELAIMQGEVKFIRAKKDSERDIEKFLDGGIDLQYVLSGTVLFSGLADKRFDPLLNINGPIFDLGFTRVHQANMKKVRSTNASDSKRGSTFDVIKPAGWQPAKLDDLLS